MMAKHNIRNVGLATRNISGFLCPVKDSPELRTLGYMAYNVNVARCTSDRLFDR